MGDRAAAAPPIGTLDECIISRQTNRRRFTDEVVDPELVAAAPRRGLRRAGDPRRGAQPAAPAGGGPAQPGGRPAAERRSRLPGRAAGLDDRRPHPAGRRAGAGGAPRDRPVPATTSRSGTSTPVASVRCRRRPDPTWASRCSSSGRSATTRLSWLRAGEALERLWLEITRQGYVASLFTQVIEVPYLRQQLRIELGLVAVSARPGAGGQGGSSTSASMRRRLQDVVVDRTTAPARPARASTVGGLPRQRVLSPCRAQPDSDGLESVS